jgi:hypothetical protein
MRQHLMRQHQTLRVMKQGHGQRRGHRQQRARDDQHNDASRAEPDAVAQTHD